GRALRLSVAAAALSSLALDALAGQAPRPKQSSTSQQASQPASTSEVDRLRSEVEGLKAELEQLRKLIEAGNAAKASAQPLQPAEASRDSREPDSQPSQADKYRATQDSGAAQTQKQSTQKQSTQKQSTIDTLIKPKAAGGQFAGSEGLLKTDRVKVGG